MFSCGMSLFYRHRGVGVKDIPVACPLHRYPSLPVEKALPAGLFGEKDALIAYRMEEMLDAHPQAPGMMIEEQG